MGLGELFGVKNEKLNLSKEYDFKSLYEAIKDVEFEAGKPSLVKHGFADVIVFPQLDRNNQIWISKGLKGEWIVMRSVQPAGVGNVLKNELLETVTDGWSGLSGAFGDTKKKCMELVVKTAETINALGL